VFQRSLAWWGMATPSEATLRTDPHPLVEFVKIKGPGEH
jgi:hypothetical protein